MLLIPFLEIIREYGLDAYIHPLSDEHFNEVISPADERIRALTGFTGTFGTAITGLENVFFTTEQFSDQAREEITDYRIIDEGITSMTSWIISSGIKKIGICSKLIPSKQFIKLYRDLKDVNIELISYSNDLLDKLWKPKRVFNPLFDLERHRFREFVELSYIKTFPEFKISDSKGYDLRTIVTGEVYQKRVNLLRRELKKNEGFIISNVNTIAWLTNLRGNDLPFSSLFYSFAYLTRDKLRLFTGHHVTKEGIDSLPYSTFYNFLDKIEEDKVYISGDVNFFIYSKLKNPEYSDLIDIAVSKKNKAETFGFKMAGIKDAQAIIKLFVWLEGQTGVTERDIQDKLIYLKSLNKGYFSESFSPIVASGRNTSKIYHKATHKIHNKDDLLLIDTGSHYMHGTTDITRTVCLGRPSSEMIKYYTITLKSLVRAKYIRRSAIKGRELDEAARYYLRKIGKDYRTSTGHGVGYFGHVHEIFPKINNEEDTMGLFNVFTLEPSYFNIKNGIGIRLEDQVFLNESDNIAFQTNLSFVPLQINMIDNSMLTEGERKAINLYSRKMREFLSPLFKEDTLEYKFLVRNTEKLAEIEQTNDVDGPIYTFPKK